MRRHSVYRWSGGFGGRPHFLRWHIGTALGFGALNLKLRLPEFLRFLVRWREILARPRLG